MGLTLDDTWSVEAVIFDMDGLSVDTERLAMCALGAAANSMGVDVPEAFHRALIGVPADACRRMDAARRGPGFPVQAYFESADRYMAEMIEAGQPRPKPGATELLAWLEQRRVPRAVATSSARAKTQHHLWMTGILNRFDAVVTRDDVERGKPHPDPYLRAAERLGTPTGRCLALEDSYDGVRAAHAAGVRVIMVPDLLRPTEEVRSMCEAILPDLQAVRDLLGRADAVRAASASARAA